MATLKVWHAKVPLVKLPYPENLWGTSASYFPADNWLVYEIGVKGCLVLGTVSKTEVPKQWMPKAKMKKNTAKLYGDALVYPQSWLIN